MKTRPGISRTLSQRSRARAPEAEGGEALAAKLRGELGTLFGRLADAVAAAANAAQEGTQAESGERSIEIGGRTGRLVFGYSIRVGLDGAKGEPFGHVAGGRPAASADAERQPIVDIIEEADAVVVIAEVPGVSEQDVTVTVDRDNRLRITTPPPLRYGRTVPLPAAVDSSRMSFACRNGILEVRLPRLDRGGA